MPTPVERLRHESWDDIADATAIPEIVSEIDRLAAASPDEDTGNTPQDRLFEILMVRFDAMTPYKKGLISLASYAQKDPETAFILYKALSRSINACLEKAGFQTSLNHQSLRSAILTAGYGHVFLRWSKDNSSDSAETMAVLNDTIKTGIKFGLLKGA